MKQSTNPYVAAEPFWLVWNPSDCPPLVKHKTREEAEKEAERLARCNPDETFHVLKLEATCEARGVVWTKALEFASFGVRIHE